jgi:hypothetical protein
MHGGSGAVLLYSSPITAKIEQVNKVNFVTLASETPTPAVYPKSRLPQFWQGFKDGEVFTFLMSYIV